MTNKNLAFKPIDPSVSKVIDKHGSTPESVLDILTELNSRNEGFSRSMLSDIARGMGLPEERIYGIASFYSMLAMEPRPTHSIHICDGPACWLKGAGDLSGQLATRLAKDPDWTVGRSSCLGLCDRAPAVLVDGQQVGPFDLKRVGDFPVDPQGIQPDYSHPRRGEVRVMMAKAGRIDPDSLESAVQQGAYGGLQVALRATSEKVIETLEASGLQGRGGAGFPVGRKWRFVANESRLPKYVICNADESEPLIFKDRVLIDTDPHQVLEGMAIAGYATGAEEAFIYIRGEYPKQAEKLKRAIKQAEEANLLGENILGSGYSFHIHIHRGAGAYICGEETALIESLEGKRGEPRARPPYPPQFGYLGMPTLVNNVESFAAVPSILKNGAEWWRSLSDYSTPGTKMYMLLGHVNRPGLFEAPFGLTLRQVIDDFGGGMLPGSEFHFALTGGAAGTIVPDTLLDIPIDFASSQHGLSLGAGAFLICDQTVSPVKMLRELLHFFTLESCGKCTPCREGTVQSLEILNRFSKRSALAGDLERLKELADVMQVGSFCGLGQSVAIPMKSAYQHFEREFKEAIK